MVGLDLAVIGNCTVASVITPAGRHVWFCFPRLDADPLFNALLGGKAPAAGYMDATLRDQTGAEQRYVPNTAVLETVLTDNEGGRARMIDFCPRFHRYGRLRDCGAHRAALRADGAPEYRDVSGRNRAGQFWPVEHAQGCGCTGGRRH